MSRKVENVTAGLEVEEHQEEQIYLQPEIIKTTISFLFLFFAFSSTLLVLAIIHERVPDQDKYPPLSDYVLDILPETEKVIKGSEIIISVMTSVGIPLIFIFHKYRFIVLRRVFFITGLLYCMRCVTMFVTVLPVSTHEKYCLPKSNNTNVALWIKRAWRLGTGFGLVISGQHKYCGDLIFSGHTVILCMGSLVISEYTPKTWYLIHWVSWILTISGIIMILWAHQHYTIDVLIAYYATTRIFWLYHMFANYIDLREGTNNNYISRVWWFRIIRYLEKNTNKPIPPVLEVPFHSCRLCFRKRGEQASI